MKRMSKIEDRTLPEIPALPQELIDQAFPGGFTIRDEANALTAFAFRNGQLEKLHAGKSSALSSDPSPSRITDAEMQNLMIEASEKLESLLRLRDADPTGYQNFVRSYALSYCRSWER
jgi:hypothetical protein